MFQNSLHRLGWLGSPRAGDQLVENRRSDERIFRFLAWLRVDEADEVPMHEAVRVAREQFPRAGQPDVCLVISHAHRIQLNEAANRRLAPEDALKIEHQTREAPGTNQPQTMRVWPGLKLVGAGGRVAKGVFARVQSVGERVVLDSGLSFAPQDLLRATRLCHAVTYASCQGLTLTGRVWLYDTGSQHFTIKLQADLIDFSQNTKSANKVSLVVTDVFTREAVTRALPNKRADTVAQAAAELIPKL
ncbi:unnamed protein product, partial [Symbiodinium sp. CCMP2456]